MYMRDLLRSLQRRWYLTAACLLTALLLSIVAMRVVPPLYETNVSVLLVPPRNPDSPQANRFLALGSLTQAKDVLVRAMNSDETKQRLSQNRKGRDYDVAADVTTAAPIIVITVRAETVTETNSLSRTVLKYLPVSLSSLQAKLAIQPSDQIVAVTISPGTKPKIVSKAVIRAVLATLAVSLAGGAALIGFIDGLLLRRRRPRSRTTPRSTGRTPQVRVSEGGVDPRNGRPLSTDGRRPPADTNEGREVATGR